MQAIGDLFTFFWAAAAEQAWGMPLVGLLTGAGLYFTLAARFTPFGRVGHALQILRGEYDDPDDPGEITHFQALSSALAATVGMGNIAGVAVAITMGGPGAVFWMWVAALLGMSTKYFTCTLACLHRKEDAEGVVQGGPMYFIEVGLGPQARALALMFAAAGMVGCLSMFNVNQLASHLDANYGVAAITTGLTSMVFVALVILGGIVRVGRVTARLVPAMALLYGLMCLVVIVRYLAVIPALLLSIFEGALRGGAVVGGTTVSAARALIIGVRRGVFSNEAGLGTAAMAHGAAKTDEPVREGLVAMLGPFIDTNVICTMTALVILTGEGAHDQPRHGLIITAGAFARALPGVGDHLLTLAVTLFAVSTMISYAYYSVKCARYLFGDIVGRRYVYVYLAMLPLGAIWSQAGVVGLVDTAFALMAIPTLVSAVIMSGQVRAATREYFSRQLAS